MVRLPGPVGPLVHAERAVYAAYPSLRPGSGRGLGRIARFDVGTGAVVKSAPFHGGHDLAVAGGSLWANATPPWSGTLRQRARRALYRLDLRSLRIELRLKLPVAPGPLAASPAGLWVGAGRYLYLMDPRSGRIRRTVGVEGVVAQLAVDPTGQLLYVARHPEESPETDSIEQRDARSGTLRMVTPPGAVGEFVNWLSPTARGVWVSILTGNFGTALFLREADLHPIRNTDETAQNVEATVAAGNLWLQTSLGRSLICANPHTGRFEDTITIPEAAVAYGSLSNVVVGGGDVFVGAGRGLVRANPSLCDRSPESR